MNKMEHLREFDFFSMGKQQSPDENKLGLFIRNNYSRIASAFSHIGEGLNIDDIEAPTDLMFTVSYSPPHEEMPSRISYLVDDITEKMKSLIGDPMLSWRFGHDDPFTIRFILSKPL
jgi:hypothetical protein